MVVLPGVAGEGAEGALPLGVVVTSTMEVVEEGLTLRMVSSSSNRSFQTSSKVGNGRERLRRVTMWLYRSFRPRRTFSTSV